MSGGSKKIHYSNSDCGGGGGGGGKLIPNIPERRRWRVDGQMDEELERDGWMRDATGHDGADRGREGKRLVHQSQHT